MSLRRDTALHRMGLAAVAIGFRVPVIGEQPTATHLDAVAELLQAARAFARCIDDERQATQVSPASLEWR